MAGNLRVTLIIMAALVAVLLALGACSLALGARVPTAVKIEIGSDEFASQNNVSRTVSVPVGGTLTIALGANPSTGFSWSEPPAVSDAAVLEQTSNKLLLAEAKPIVGQPATQAWTMRALQPGTSTVNMTYGRPWPGGKKGIWTFEVNVTVKEK